MEVVRYLCFDRFCPGNDLHDYGMGCGDADEECLGRGEKTG